MKKFFVLFVTLAALLFVVSCGNGKNKDDIADPEEEVTDTGKETTDPGEETTDPEEDCINAGGTWNADQALCTRTVDCDDKPANSEWNGDSTYTSTYWDGSWNSVYSTYSEIEGACHFKCTQNHFWLHSTCFSPCDADPCGTITGFSNMTCAALNEEEYSCGGTDLSTGLTWSTIPFGAMTYTEAISYCDDLNENGYSDWRLPNMSELRTLVQNCETVEMPNGSCMIREDECAVCLEFDSCFSVTQCRCEEDGAKYDKLKSSYAFWSSSVSSDQPSSISDLQLGWTVNFLDAGVYWDNIIEGINVVRCVRSDEEPITSCTLAGGAWNEAEETCECQETSTTQN